MADGRILPYLDVPFQHSHPDVLKRMKRPASGEKQPRAAAALARDLPGARRPQHLHRRLSRARPRPSSSTCSTSCARRASTAPAASPIRRSTARRANELPGMLPPARARGAARALHGAWPRRSRPRSCARASARRCRCWSIRRRRSAARAASGRSYADAPEIDGRVTLLPPEKASKTLKAGEFTRARIVGTPGPRPGRRCRSDASSPPIAMTEEPMPTRRSTALIHHPTSRRPASWRCSRRCTRRRRCIFAERRRAARARLEGEDRLHLRPARHADDVHARGAHRDARRRHCRPLLVPSGLAAITLVDMALLKAGDEVLHARQRLRPGQGTARATSSRAGASRIASTTRWTRPRWPPRSAATRLVWLEAPAR